MNLEAAIDLIRQHWAYLADLHRQFPHKVDAPRVNLLAASAFRGVQEYVIYELSACMWEPLYYRLRMEPHASHIDDKPGDRPILQLLWRIIDRREEFGIGCPYGTAATWRDRQAWRARHETANRKGRASAKGEGKEEEGEAA